MGEEGKKKPEDSSGNLNIEYPVMPTVNELVHDNYFEFQQNCCDNACDKLNNALLFNIRNNIPRKYFETNFAAALQALEPRYDTTSAQKVAAADKNLQRAVGDLMAKMEDVEGCPMLQAGATYWDHGDMTRSRVVRIGLRDPPKPAPENLITNSHLYNVFMDHQNAAYRFAFPPCPIFLIRQPRGEERCSGYANRHKLEYFIESDLIIQIIKQPGSVEYLQS